MQCRASILGLFIGLAPLAALSQTLDDTGLCEGTAIVTGTRDDTRAEALARALRDVLVKTVRQRGAAARCPGREAGGESR